MEHEPENDDPWRRPNRAAWHDYRSRGGYFITICTHQMAMLFGDVHDEETQLNPAGQVVEEWWRKLPERFPDVGLDAYIIMPNHDHGIIILTDDGGASLPEVVQWFKTMTTNAYIRGVKTLGWPPFNRHVWKRSYFDQIIRSDRHIDNARLYIEANPFRWQHDKYNPRQLS